MKFGEIKGIKIKIHISAILFPCLVGFYAAKSYFDFIPGEVSIIELLLVGIINGIIFLFSILIHELMHSIMAQRYGLNVSEIELNMFGGVSKIEEEPRTPESEIIIAAVGPFSSLVIGAGFYALFFTSGCFPTFLMVTFLYSGFLNIILGIFNLIPAFPMDGGRILRAFLWMRRNDLISATKTASKIGIYFGLSLMIYGFYQILFFDLLNGFWLILIGSFLKSSAKQSYIHSIIEMKLSKIMAKDVIDAPKFEIPFNMLLNDALREYFMIYNEECFLVVKEDRLVGIIYIEDLKKIPIEKRSKFIVGYVMKGISEFPSINEKESGREALKKMIQMRKKPYVVVVKENNDDHVIGIIDEKRLFSSLRLMWFKNQLSYPNELWLYFLINNTELKSDLIFKNSI